MSTTSAIKLVLIIAVGVVVGLALWTGGVSLVVHWRAESDRPAFKVPARPTTQANASLGVEKAWSNALGRAKASIDGTLEERIHRQPEWRERAEAVGIPQAEAELLSVAQSWHDAAVRDWEQRRLRDLPEDDDDWRFRQDLQGLTLDLSDRGWRRAKAAFDGR